MNKYIKTDIEQALILLKSAINNALSDIENGVETSIELGKHVPFSYIIECAEQRGWIEDQIKNGWECDAWYYMLTPNCKSVCIEGYLFKGLSTKIYIDNNL